MKVLYLRGLGNHRCGHGTEEYNAKMVRKEQKPGRKSKSQPRPVSSLLKRRAEKVSTVHRQAVTYLEAGLPGEARRICEAFLQRYPRHAGILNLGGVACFQCGEGSRGIQMLEAALVEDPEFTDAFNNLGNVFKALGRLAEAEQQYRQAIEIDHYHADAHFNLAMVIEIGGRLAEAEEAYRTVLNIQPGFVPAYQGLGNVLKILGRLDESLAVHNQLLALAPGHVDGHNNRGTVLFEMSSLDAALKAYSEALSLQPGHADAAYNSGVALQEMGRFDEAIRYYRQALEARPGYVEVHVNLGYALHQTGKIDEAQVAYENAIKLAPDHAQAHVNLGDLYLDQEDLGSAGALCDRYLDAHPGDSALLAFKSIVLDELGNGDAMRKLVDYTSMVQPVSLEDQVGATALRNLNSILADHICAHPSLAVAPTSHTTRKGKHTGELLTGDPGPIAELEPLLRGAIEAFCAELPVAADHPFAIRRPSDYWLSLWAVVLNAQGHQVPHIHPSAWLSGVYYVEVPEIVSGSDDHAGWIEFGSRPQHFHARSDPAVRCFEPKEGLLLLFPSYIYHRTVPYGAEQRRISMAFDVIPA